MALVKCPECGKEISSKAAACPNCGNPMPKQMCDIIFQRLSTMMVAVMCNVSIDGNPVGTIKSGDELRTTISVGTHRITLESYAAVRAAVPASQVVENITVEENTKQVNVRIKTKAGLTAGKCVFDSITYN